MSQTMSQCSRCGTTMIEKTYYGSQDEYNYDECPRCEKEFEEMRQSAEQYIRENRHRWKP